jgi:hypothetical protein
LIAGTAVSNVASVFSYAAYGFMKRNYFALTALSRDE